MAIEAKIPSPRLEDENSQHSENLLHVVEHESDFEEDDDYYQLKNDDLHESDLLRSVFFLHSVFCVFLYCIQFFSERIRA